MIPLHKSDSKQLMNNYRPIALVSPLSKILEQLMVTQLNTFLKMNKLLFEKKFGFQRNLNTEDAIRYYHETLQSAKCSVVIATDLKKALDTVSHTLLKTKLKILIRIILISRHIS